MTKNIIIRVYGRVQGVGFRYYTREMALKSWITGYVSNEADGSVYIEAEGAQEHLDVFIRLCKAGPARAIVTDFRKFEGTLMNYSSFRIK